MEIVDIGALEELTLGSGNDDYDSPGKGFCDPPTPEE